MTEPGTTPAGHGMLYAVLAAASAALLLFLPVLLLGYTVAVLMTVARGEGLAWASSVGMAYAFIGIPSLLGLLLLPFPYALFRAAGRRLGTRQAIRWVGGLLAASLVGVAFIWVQQALSGSRPVLEEDELWYAAAFGIAALVILIATIVAEKRAVGAAVALGGGVTVALVALVAVLVSVWGSGMRIPPGAQVVTILLAAGEVNLEPATVHAGDVYFLIEGPEAEPEQAGFAFMTGGYRTDCCDRPLPLSDDTLAGLPDGDYQGTSFEGGWYGDSAVMYSLVTGTYAFIIGGGLPGVPPDSVALLEVVP